MEEAIVNYVCGRKNVWEYENMKKMQC